MQIIRAAVVALGSFASIVPAPAAQDARVASEPIVDLGTLGGLASITVAVNDRRQVIGLSEVSPFGDIHSFLWEDGVMRDLSDTGPVRFDGVQGINDRGQIVGVAVDASFNTAAAIWEDERVTTLAVPSGAIGCSGFAINDHGDVAGLCFQQSGTVGVVWTRQGRIFTIGAVPGVGPYVPTAIANDGLVVGYINAATGFAGGFAWKNGVVTRLDPFVVAEDVNDHGQIAGWGRPGGLVTALLLDRRRGLATLPALFAGASSQAFAIDRHGAIAGTSGGDAVVWTGGPPRVLPPLPGGLFANTTDLNDRGDVAGYATTPGDGNTHAVLWPGTVGHRQTP